MLQVKPECKFFGGLKDYFLELIKTTIHHKITGKGNVSASYRIIDNNTDFNIRRHEFEPRYLLVVCGTIFYTSLHLIFFNFILRIIILQGNVEEKK